MLAPGVYPASVTPFDARGCVDAAGVARLLAWFEASGCRGAVLAGTNGEGPSLSAVEKRDLLESAAGVRGSLELILGVATPSLDEAVWLCRQAHRFGAASALVMAPFYFRDAPEEGIEHWFLELLDASPLPVLVYNFPQKAGIVLRPELIGRLARHERFLGAKDSSGDATNLRTYREAVEDRHLLFVGNETLLAEALGLGWSGTISGAANVLPQWLSAICGEWASARESAEAKFALALDAIGALRAGPQPALNKAVLHRLGVLSDPRVRSPLVACPADRLEQALQTLEETLGARRGAL